jgi:hypothetical protein
MESTGTVETKETYEDALVRIKRENPGTEVWEGKTKLGDRWIYRAPTKFETKTYRRLLRVERDKGAEGDLDVAYEMLVLGGTDPKSPPGCVLYPVKVDLIALLHRRSMLAATMAGEICEVAGMVDEVERKKL